MTTTEWIINFALIAVVLRQIHAHRIDAKFVLIPLALVGYSAYSYLDAFPTAGNDLVLIISLGALGAALGLLGGILTRVRAGADRTFATAQARFWAATLWIVGMSGRIAFVLWVEHGGSDTVARFSAAHHITGSDAWTDALIVMVLAEVVTRLTTIVVRGQHTLATARSSEPVELPTAA